MERSDRGLFWNTIPANAWINWVKPRNLNSQSPNTCKSVEKWKEVIVSYFEILSWQMPR